MHVVRSDHWTNRGDLEHVMPLRLRVVTVQRLLALRTARGMQHDDFIDFFYREQLSRLAGVPGLAPRTTSTGLTATARPLACRSIT